MLKDDKIKELFRLLTIVEKLIIRIISIIGWIKILIGILK
jgi:hypothetical protein